MEPMALTLRWLTLRHVLRKLRRTKWDRLCLLSTTLMRSLSSLVASLDLSLLAVTYRSRLRQTLCRTSGLALKSVAYHSLKMETSKRLRALTLDSALLQTRTLWATLSLRVSLKSEIETSRFAHGKSSLLRTMVCSR